MSVMFTAAASAWRFRNDNGTETTATWMAAQNTTPSNVEVDTVFRLRFRAGDTAGASGTLTPRIRFSQNGGAYTEASTSTAVKLVTSSNVTNGTATTAQLTGGSAGAFVAGAVRDDNAHAVVNIGASGNTESEWVLQFDSSLVANGDTFNFQLYNSTTALSQVTASVTALKSDVTAPSIPTNVIATSTGATSISVSWDASTDDTAAQNTLIYEVQRSLNGTTGWTTVHTTAAGVTSWSNTGLSDSTTYYYQVRVRDTSSNWSNWSSTASASTADATPPTVPANLAVSVVNSTALGVSWDASTDSITAQSAIVYEVRRSLDNASWTPVHTSSPGSVTWSDTNLTPSTLYYYSVRAVDEASNWSNWSTSASATTSAPPPNATVTYKVNVGGVATPLSRRIQGGTMLTSRSKGV